ncbi:MAG TPA: hypothetical protein VIQ62_11305 [Burkholderiales bacterium]|jgi:hypothetical protein
MIDAPAARHSAAVSAISCGVYGTFELISRVAYSLMRTVMMSGLVM